MVHQSRRSCSLDSVGVDFDDEGLIAGAGMILPATLADRLGIAELVSEKVRLDPKSPGAALPHRKVMTLISGMLSGADSIDDCDVLRSANTASVLGHRVMAPSTLGTFLRAFTFGHARQMESVASETLTRAWQTGAGPGTDRLILDLDSFIGQAYGTQKQGASFGYTKQRGYHPLLCSRAGAGDVVGIRLRKGSANTQRGIARFIGEILAAARRGGAKGKIVIRADSGFHNQETFQRLEAEGVEYSITARMAAPLKQAISEIPEARWRRLDNYPEPGIAEIAETTHYGRRVIVRRVRELSDQQELLANWRHHPVITNRGDAIEVVDSEHREHAVVELTIRDLKAGALAHFPSGEFSANAAWTQIAVIAHNLARWTQVLGLPGSQVRTFHTFLRRMITLPGRIITSARKQTLRLPARWPWQRAFIEALERIRALPALA